MILLVILIIGCGSTADDIEDFFHPPNTEPIRATVKTAVPLAYVAAVSMAVIKGYSPAGVLSADTCGSFPCAALILIELEPGDIPFAYDSEGTALVTGLWTSPNQAILTVSFLGVQPGVPSYLISKISTFPVIATQTPVSGLKLVYANVDINISSDPDDGIELTDPQIQAEYDRLEAEISNDPEINISMDAWVIELADAGTPDVFSDDRYTISGGGQYVDVTSNGSSRDVELYQLGMAQAYISHDCSRNPTSGLAVIQEVNTTHALPVMANAVIQFNSACNGSAYVMLATGNYITSIGSSVDLDLDNP
jgi:hypothetical protein